ncbi:hypothetical protein N9M08_07055 [Porticoccaceae bacterium]|nr:hypothetical protein [Porticoccaceae bacterium]MDA8682276.1 hypothetical protein [Porticoccaceae bacterium]MDA8788894.1 hypothetical protein [Porticoccaceae bacterium]MDB2343804.1 hypothetical protein [Porticoccaceae bacterium]
MLQKIATKITDKTTIVLSTGGEIPLAGIKGKEQFRLQIPTRNSLVLRRSLWRPLCKARVTSFIGEFDGLFFDDESPRDANSLVGKFAPLGLADIKAPDWLNCRFNECIDTGFSICIPFTVVLTNMARFVIEDCDYTIQRHYPD